MKKEKLYLSKTGYDEYLKEIERLEKELNDIGKRKSSAYTSGVGDGWHDNAEFEEATREELRIKAKILEKKTGLRDIVIIDQKADEDDTVDINDYVTVTIECNGNVQELTFQLVAGYNPDLDKDVSEITVNSPLGASVYQRSIGDNSEYVVNGNVFKIVILSKKKLVVDNDVSVDETQSVKKKTHKCMR